MLSPPIGGQDDEEMMTELRGEAFHLALAIEFYRQQHELALPMAQPYSIPLYRLEVNANTSHNHGANLKALSLSRSRESRFKETNLVGRTRVRVRTE